MSAPVTLLRSLLRTSRSLTDFNVKAYARRRTMVGFRQNQVRHDELRPSPSRQCAVPWLL
jgi:hypothetical protein